MTQWSYGEDVYKICKTYLQIRETLRDYTRSLMKAAHEKGTPVMRPLFYEFPGDPKCWEVEDQYMYGNKYLCCPVLYPDQRKKKAYLPNGPRWKLWDGKEVWEGGQMIEVDSPINFMPVFVKQ